MKINKCIFIFKISTIIVCQYIVLGDMIRKTTALLKFHLNVLLGYRYFFHNKGPGKKPILIKLKN